MPRTISPDILKVLDNADWLYKNHVVDKISISVLARQLNITPGSVRKYIRKHKIESPSQQELREASNLRNFGKKNPGQVKEFRDKALLTMNDKFGGHIWSNCGNRKQRNQTCLELYGNVNVGKTEYAINKAKQTNLTKYSREHINQSHISDLDYEKLSSIDWIWEQHSKYNRTLSDIATECNVDMTIIMNRLRQYGLETKHFFRSTGEREVFNFIQELLPNIEIRNNDRTIISPNELDIYIPSYNIAIEYCGLYWHSDLFKKNQYHITKLHQCNANNIRLITIFEDEWMNNQVLVKQKIKVILGLNNTNTIYARKTEIVTITPSIKRQFLDKNHIQGNGRGSITYGLMYNNQLVAVMTFVKRANNKYELNRYATSSSVVGGFSKLLSHFKLDNNWNEIISFADLRWSEGTLYERTGWVLDKILPPDYCWIKNNQRYHKFNFRHKQLKTKLKKYDPQLSENTNCKNNGYLKLYNCGLKRYYIKATT